MKVCSIMIVVLYTWTVLSPNACVLFNLEITLHILDILVLCANLEIEPIIVVSAWDWP